MSELTYPVEVIDDGTGLRFYAHSAVCQCSNIDPDYDEGMGSEAFLVFWDPRHNPPHLHLQCFDCKQSYCPYGLCVPPPTAEIYDGQK